MVFTILVLASEGVEWTNILPHGTKELSCAGGVL